MAGNVGGNSDLVKTSPAAGGAANPGYATGGSKKLEESAKRRRLSEFKYGAPHETRRFNKKNEALDIQARKNVLDRVASGISPLALARNSATGLTKTYALSSATCPRIFYVA